MLETLIDIDIAGLNLIREILYFEHPVWFWLIKILSDLEVLFIAVFLIAYWLIGTRKKDDAFKKRALEVFYFVAGVFVIYVILNQFLPVRPRPETVSQLPPIIEHLPNNSFPSGHAIFAAASFLAIHYFVRSKTLTLVVFTLGVLMCFARVVSGIHYPGDMVAGYTIGIAGFYLMYPTRNSSLFHKYLLPIPVTCASYLKL